MSTSTVSVAIALTCNGGWSNFIPFSLGHSVAYEPNKALAKLHIGNERIRCSLASEGRVRAMTRNELHVIA